MSKYVATWEPMSLNKAFWTEVLVGRSIVEVVFDDDGITGLRLDNGETVHVKGAGLLVND